MRTAPVPNMVAIPGMNPGTIVAGGGGGSGGGGKGSGKDGKGGDGNDGEEGGEDTTGGGAEGEGADACGDPVCPVSGRMFLDLLEFAFPGPLPFRFVRSYSSRTSDLLGDLGRGWTHNFGWRLRRRRRHVLIVDDANREQRLPTPKKNAPATNALGWKLSKTSAGYELWMPKSERRIRFEGPVRGGWIFQTAIEDRNRNATRIERDEAGRLTQLIDSAGRPYRVQTTAQGFVERIAVAADAGHSNWIDVARYEYDERGNLIRAADAEGHVKDMFYDGHLLVEHRLPCGLSYCYRYDGRTREARCVESWGEYIGLQDPALEHPLPARPTQGPDTRPIKGINYVKLTYVADTYTEVENGLGGLDRYFGDELGRVVKHVDAIGRVQERAFDPATGRTTQATNGSGATRNVLFDGEGNPIGFVDAAGRKVLTVADTDGTLVDIDERNGRVTRRRYDTEGNLVYVGHADGTHEEHTRDSRGLLLARIGRDGGLSRHDYDQMGNLVRSTLSHGGVFANEFDYLGRRTRHIDMHGHVTEWRYDLLNEVVAVIHADGSSIHLTRDANSKPVRVVESGRAWNFSYGGLGWLTDVVGPRGDVTSYRYDVEGNLTYVRNPRGQVYNQRFDVTSRPIGANTFEDIDLVGQLDAEGHLITSTTPLGKASSTYDDQGLLVSVEYPDGETVALEHEIGFGLSKVDNGSVLVEQFYDGAGQIIDDFQGEHHNAITWVGGEVGRIVSDVGVPVGERRRVASVVRELEAGQTTVTLHVRDGTDYLAHFGEHLALRTRRGPTGLLIYQALERRFRDHVAPDEDGRVLWSVRYEFGEDQCLRKETHSTGQVIEYDVDIAGQVTEQRVLVAGALQRQEQIRYDAAGSPVLPGEVFDHWARPVGLADETFEYDAEGRLSRRVTTQGPWTYAWSASGTLLGVDAPSHRVELDYDGRGRLARKRVFRDNELVKRISYVWANQVILHEHDELSGGTRTYVRESYSWEPLGHVDRTASGEETLCVYVHDPAGALDFAVDGRGKRVFEAERSVFGDYRVTRADVDVSVRMVNQHADPDVGFVYNRFRWYDPRLGLFVSRDPIELDGNINPRDYVPNPRRYIDPLGLAMVFRNNPQPDGHGHPTRPARPHSGMTDDEVATYLRSPGHFATNGTEEIPGYVVADEKERSSRSFRSSTTAAIDKAGNEYGCHSCGRSRKQIHKEDGKFGHWRKDHQPPLSDVPAGDAVRSDNGQPVGEVRIYPHCPRCSNTQGGLLASRPPGNAEAVQAAATMAPRSSDDTRRGPARRPRR